LLFPKSAQLSFTSAKFAKMHPRKGHNSEPENEEVSFGEQRWICVRICSEERSRRRRTDKKSISEQ